MTEPKIVVGKPVFIKADNEYQMDMHMAKIKLENCDSTKYRAFEHIRPPPGMEDPGPHEIFKKQSYRKDVDDEIPLQKGSYTFYLFCGENLDDIRGTRENIFDKVKSYCSNPQNGCKMATTTQNIGALAGGRRRSSKHRRSSGHRRSGGRRHRKSHRRRR